MGHYESKGERIQSTRRRKRQDELDWRKRRSSPLTNFNGSVVDLLRMLPKDRRAVQRPDVVVSTLAPGEVSPRNGAGAEASTVDAVMARYGLGSAQARADYQRRHLESMGR